MRTESILKKSATRIAPLLGAGAVGACPLCWAGSASLLAYVGLGALVGVWPWLVVALMLLGIVGFALDYRSHRNPVPLILLVAGGVLLYVGRYVFAGANWGYWPIWGTGAALIVVAVVLNRRAFSKRKKAAQ